MINGDYQKSLYSITEYANKQILSFNTFVNKLTLLLDAKKERIRREKEKLGYE